MNIYFACSITGGRQYEAQYQHIVTALIANGHQVPTAGLASSDVIALEEIVKPIDVYKRDTRWIRDCDVMIAEVSTPSHGVGYEIGYALHQSKPVICIYQEDERISKMILGNQNPRLYTYGYSVIEDALRFVQNKLDEIKVRFQENV